MFSFRDRIATSRRLPRLSGAPRPSRRRARVLATVGLTALVGVQATIAVTGPADDAAAGPPPGENRYKACVGYADFARWNPVAAVRSDTFTWRSYDPVKVGDGTGDVDWSSNPYRQVSWYMWLHSLRWLGAALDAGRAGDAQALAHAKTVAHDWVLDHPKSWKANVGAWESTMHRTNMLLCLRNTVVDANGGTLPPEDAWLDTALLRHAEFMREHYSGDANHGTDESLAMLGVGATLGNSQYVEVARQRLEEGLQASIDAQGGTNEQSTGYAFFNAYLWNRVGTEVSKLLPGSTLADAVTKRRSALLTFIAHSFTPEGTPFQLGNTEAARQTPYPDTDQAWPASGGRTGQPPKDRTATYDAAGFAFGRDTWGTDPATFAASSAYALRYGPRRARHGHADHASLTWVADGQPVLIDPGYGEYTRDEWQAYAKSPQAHNQLVVDGMRETMPTTLTRRAPTGDERTGIGDYYRLVDQPGPGFTRTRDVLIMSNPEAVVVVDRASAPRSTTFTQLWHLPSHAAVRLGPNATTANTAVAANTKTRQTTITSLPYPGRSLPRDAMRVVTGSTHPVQGWWWPSMFVKQPVPVVSITASGRSAALLTVITYARAKTPMVATTTAGPTGSTITTLKIGSESVRFSGSADGSLHRIR